MQSWKDIEARREEAVAKKTEEKKQVESIKDAFAQVARSPEGKDVLKYISQYLMWKTPTFDFRHDGSIDLVMSAMNESRRAAWLELRELIPVAERNEIEADR